MIIALESLYNLQIDPSLGRMRRKSILFTYISLEVWCLCAFVQRQKQSGTQPSSPSTGFQKKCFCEVQIPATGRTEKSGSIAVLI